MTACWNCQQPTDPVATPRCASCNKLQPLPAGVSHFAVLGLPEGYGVDVSAVDAAYRQKSLQVHPDRFARAEPKERRIAAERTAAVNAAYSVLKHPFLRAAYLVERAGVKLDEKPDPMLLMELMETREAAEESDSRRAALVEKTRAEKETFMTTLSAQLETLQREGRLHDKAAMAPVASTLIRVKYLGRLLDDLMGVRDEALTPGMSLAH
ncbi:MAG: Fe-S protein assembly co-chaperone HscB [Myxococcota bacterium]